MLSRNNREGKPKQNSFAANYLVLESREDSRKGGQLITEAHPISQCSVEDKEAKSRKGGTTVWQREISKFSNCSRRTAKG